MEIYLSSQCMMDCYEKYIKYRENYFDLCKNINGGGERKELYKQNIKLLNDHGTDGSYLKWKKENKITGPYCLSFRINNKMFNYIGAQHTVDKKSPTFKLIRKVINKFKPMLIVIEGVEYKKGLNPLLKNFQNEGSYAVSLGKRYGADFIGTEGDEGQLFDKLAKQFKKEDITGFIFLRMHKYYYRTKKESKDKFIDDFNKIYHTDQFDPIQWFENTFSKTFKYGRFLEYASPYDGKNAVITQIISAVYSKNRDINNIKRIYEFINKYDNILYIMGENHVYADKDVLVDTFGNYQIIM
jgi:hypothetical protein